MGVADAAADLRAALAELAEGARALGLQLSGAQIACFETYIDTLLVWSRRLSLTSATTAAEIVRKHLLDCLPAARLIPLPSGVTDPGGTDPRVTDPRVTDPTVADLGSGAGFPGIPLAIVRPDVRVALVEPRRKRANFLREVARRVRLPNVEVREERAEALGGALYDVVISRALWQLPELLHMGERLLKPGGLAIAMKGPKTVTGGIEPAPGFAPPEVTRYSLPGGIEHVLLVYRRR